MKSIKNIFLLNAIAMYSMHFSSFGTVLLAVLFSTAACAGETSYTVPAGASFEFKCESGTEDKCCDLKQFRDTISSGGKQTNTAEGTCMTDQGEFKYCEEQSNCTVTCSAGCTGSGKNVEENSDHNSTEPGVSTLSDCNCSGEGVCDCNPSDCSGSGCISKSEVITLAWTTVGFVFAAVFLAI